MKPAVIAATDLRHEKEITMSNEDQPTEGDIQPERGKRIPPFSDDTDTEGHMPLKRVFAEDTDVAPEGTAKLRPFTQAGDANDAEGHAGKFRPYADEPGIGPEGAGRIRPNTQGDATGIEPDGTVRGRP